MEEGSYFGEIGVLLQDRRSLSCQALSHVFVCTISRKRMLKILDNFPDHLRYLTGVAQQRLETTYTGDVDMNVEIGTKYKETDQQENNTER
jgi:CRP-like cAMP-binding protein